MPIQIVKSIEAIDVTSLCMTIYSQPGLGKTSVACTAEKPLLLDFDKGAHRAVERGDVVQITNWQDVARIHADDIETYETIVIDTVGKALDCLAQDIMRSNNRMGNGGALTQQGWGQLSVKFKAFLSLLTGFGKDVVLIAHMDEQKDGDSVSERLKISGGSKDLVLTDSDAIGRISIQNQDRYLQFTPTEKSFGKDPANLGVIPIPAAQSGNFGGFLAGVISDIKSGLNAVSEEQAAHKAEIDWFKEHLPGMETAEAINAVLDRASKAGANAKRMVMNRANEIGLKFDKASGKFIAEPEKKESDEPPPPKEDVKDEPPKEEEPSEENLSGLVKLISDELAAAADQGGVEAVFEIFFEQIAATKGTPAYDEINTAIDARREELADG